ncbi:L domain-like protein [Hymenopellis radicata]|nr:L domain-like protein [Hymenopellis radicata]
MSRVPVPSSRTQTKPAKSPSTPLRARTPVAPPARTRTTSSLSPTPTPTPLRTRTTSTLSPTPTSTPRLRTKSTTKPVPKAKVEDLPPPLPPLSIKEAIALKRAEAKKAQAPGSSGLAVESLEDAVPSTNEPAPDEDVYGRQSVKETIERARSTGHLNLATRNLPCIPSILFSIHLGVTAEPLKSVPTEPPYGSDAPPSKKAAWFEAQDLKTLKIGNNEIIEIQPEISMFGSLKNIDMHKNRLTSIPETLGDLSSLAALDLSHNALTSVPAAIFSLPELTVLNLSHNALTTLPFNAPFADGRSGSAYSTSEFFTPAVNRAITPLPRLVTLEASHNKLRAEAIDSSHIPTSLAKIDLSHNPLGIRNPATQELVRNIGSLHALTELRLGNAEIGDDAFPPDLASNPIFMVLRILDLQDTAVTRDAIVTALKGLQQHVTTEITAGEPPEGTLQVTVGKLIVKEYWEIEAERRQKARTARNTEGSGISWGTTSTKGNGRNTEVVKEPWEVEAEQGLLSEGAKRRARAQAATATAPTPSVPNKITPPKSQEKEAWEIEAEQGLLTEGGKRRARAEAALRAQQKLKVDALSSSRGPSPTNPTFSLSNPQYYDEASKTLTLPPSAPPSKVGHFRTFSCAPTSSSFGAPPSPPSDIALPTPTLPLTAILAQPFAESLRTLTLVNRRMDRCFSLLMEDQPSLPNLEELDLEGCNLSDQVAVTRSDTPSAAAHPSRSTESLLPLVTRLFPSLQALNLSYNTLSSGFLTMEALSSLILCTSQRKGLRRLALRGNKITELDGLKAIAELFKGHRDVPGWKLDELDLRDNEIGKLPPELGLLPLDVFLVDGNVFRVPARRIWEREGTKGLLSWLRGRIE